MAYEFKQKRINTDALEQDEFWYDKTGKLYEVCNMSRQHCHGAMKKLFMQFGGKVATTPLFLGLQYRAMQ